MAIAEATNPTMPATTDGTNPPATWLATIPTTAPTTTPAADIPGRVGRCEAGRRASGEGPPSSLAGDRS